MPAPLPSVRVESFASAVALLVVYGVDWKTDPSQRAQYATTVTKAYTPKAIKDSFKEKSGAWVFMRMEVKG
jgi:hypothetical protein